VLGPASRVLPVVPERDDLVVPHDRRPAGDGTGRDGLPVPEVGLGPSGIPHHGREAAAHGPDLPEQRLGFPAVLPARVPHLASALRGHGHVPLTADQQERPRQPKLPGPFRAENYTLKRNSTTSPSDMNESRGAQVADPRSVPI